MEITKILHSSFVILLTLFFGTSILVMTPKPVNAQGKELSERVAATPDRSQFWQAYTPQMFRLGPLQQALTDALAAGALITDEASAMEWAGQAPLLVEGRADNLKITRPEDLEWLRQRDH